MLLYFRYIALGSDRTQEHSLIFCICFKLTCILLYDELEKVLHAAEGEMCISNLPGGIFCIYLLSTSSSIIRLALKFLYSFLAWEIYIDMRVN